jgi:hypothetical protein
MQPILRLLASSLFVAACASTRVLRMETAPELRPTCEAAVHLFPAADRVPAEYHDLGILRVTGGVITTEEAMMSSLRSKAAELGANGMIWRSLDLNPGLLQDPSGEAVAIYIPSDSARIQGECVRAKVVRDSLRRAERPLGLP